MVVPLCLSRVGTRHSGVRAESAVAPLRSSLRVRAVECPACRARRGDCPVEKTERAASAWSRCPATDQPLCRVRVQELCSTNHEMWRIIGDTISERDEPGVRINKQTNQTIELAEATKADDRRERTQLELRSGSPHPVPGPRPRAGTRARSDVLRISSRPTSRASCDANHQGAQASVHEALFTAAQQSRTQGASRRWRWQCLRPNGRCFRSGHRKRAKIPPSRRRSLGLTRHLQPPPLLLPLCCPCPCHRRRRSGQSGCETRAGR